MQGSLEDAPIVVRESRLVAIVLLVITGIAADAMAFYGPSELWDLNPLLFAAVAGAWCLFCAWCFFRPARLEIWPNELVWVGSIGLKRRYPFAEIDTFVVNLRPRYGNEVGFNWREDSPRRTTLEKVSEVLTGLDVTIGGTWEMPTQALVDLLNRSLLRPSAWR